MDANELDNTLLEELEFEDDRVVTQSFGYHPINRGDDVVMAQSNVDVVNDRVVKIIGDQSSGDGSDDYNETLKYILSHTDCTRQHYCF